MFKSHLSSGLSHCKVGSCSKELLPKILQGGYLLIVGMLLNLACGGFLNECCVSSADSVLVGGEVLVFPDSWVGVLIEYVL